MTENEQRPFSSVWWSRCNDVRAQADSMLLLAAAMAREARQQADSLERLSEWVIRGGMLEFPDGPSFERRIGFALKDAIAFLRDIGGPHE